LVKFKDNDKAYSECIKNGIIVPTENLEIEKIKTNLKIAEEDIETAKLALSKKNYNSGYKLYYDALHSLVEAFLCFDKIKSQNHQCLFAYLCHKHHELELNWNFFEKVRTKRNGINYYGTPVDLKDWKEVEITFNLYINLLKKKIIEKTS
jgi:uncharacterized protein (UPF0332 family)